MLEKKYSKERAIILFLDKILEILCLVYFKKCNLKNDYLKNLKML